MFEDANKEEKKIKMKKSITLVIVLIWSWIHFDKVFKEIQDSHESEPTSRLWWSWLQ